MVDFTREKNQKLEQELAVTAKTLGLLTREAKNRKERMMHTYKAAFSAMKAEIAFIKKNVQSEMEIVAKTMANNVQNVLMKLKETMYKYWVLVLIV